MHKTDKLQRAIKHTVSDYLASEDNNIYYSITSDQKQGKTMSFFLTRINDQDLNLCDLDTWELLNPYGEEFDTWPNHALRNAIELYETMNEDQRRMVQFLIQFAYSQGVEDAENSY